MAAWRGAAAAAAALLVAGCLSCAEPAGDAERSAAARRAPSAGAAAEHVAAAPDTPAVATGVGAAAIPPAVHACARCHQLPSPGILPRHRWPDMIRHMQRLIEQYELGAPLAPLEIDLISRYYASHGPRYLDDTIPTYGAPTVLFAGEMLGKPPPDPGPGAEPPIISNLNIVDLDRDGRPDVLVSDVSAGALTWIARGDDGRWIETPLADVAAPARSEVVDLDGDGHLDILVAALGGITPTEEPIGSVVLLTGDGRGGFTPRTLLANVARVADVRPADVDGDGDLDVVFAAFGLYKAGRVGWLEQGADGGFTLHTVYQRNGVGHAPVADLNGDDRPDLVLLISQEHEEVVACINAGEGAFEPLLLHKAPHPMWGNSNIEVVDLDGDGDEDVVFTNGDALDKEPYPKPWHGVHWLENRGELDFVHHDIERFHGAYCAVTGDLDGDQDLDIVVTSMLNRWDDPRRQSIIWLDNDGNQNFTPRPLSPSPTYLVTADIGDLDGDGRPDVVAGGMYVLKPYFRVGRVTLWRNLGRRP